MQGRAKCGVADRNCVRSFCVAGGLIAQPELATPRGLIRGGAHHFFDHADYELARGDALRFDHQFVFPAGDDVRLSGGECFEAHAGDFLGGFGFA
jgi:hypothetical protein